MLAHFDQCHGQRDGIEAVMVPGRTVQGQDPARQLLWIHSQKQVEIMGVQIAEGIHGVVYPNDRIWNAPTGDVK